MLYLPTTGTDEIPLRCTGTAQCLLGMNIYSLDPPPAQCNSYACQKTPVKLTVLNSKLLSYRMESRSEPTLLGILPFIFLRIFTHYSFVVSLLFQNNSHLFFKKIHLY